MKTLLVVPPYRTTDVLVAKLYPMPLAAVQLAAVLREAGHEVVIKDFLTPEGQSKAAPPPSFAGKHAPPYIHFGQPLDKCQAWLEEEAEKFDAVGLMAGQCNLWETSAALGETLAKLGRPIVAGGAYVTTATEEAQRRLHADVVVTGEGEPVVVEAMERAASGWKGIMPGSPVEDLDALPLPAWDLVKLDDYPKADNRVRGVLAVSRGCPHACGFCSVHTVHSRKHRRKSIGRVREELLQLYRAGARYLCFLDDNLFLTAKATRALLALLAELRESEPGFAKVKFYVEEGIEVRLAAEPGVIGEIAAAGFQDIALGVETLSAARLKEQAKPYKPEQLAKAVAECEAAKVVPRAFYIVGLPGDTLGSVARDLVAFGRLGMAARPNNLKLYPGTACTQSFQERGWIDASYDWRLSTFYTPSGAGIDYADVRQLKTVLGAIGFAAEQFGVRVFADSLADACAAISTKRGYRARMDGEALVIEGNMFRPTPYRHLSELLLLAAGAPGAESKLVGKGRIVCKPTAEPRGVVQAAVRAALDGVELPERSRAPEPVKHAGPIAAPRWIEGDSQEVGKLLGGRKAGLFDFIFSCPPYANLEVYSDDERDLSTMTYPDFLTAYRRIIKNCVDLLKPNRFAVFVVGEARGKDGNYYGLVPDTIKAFQEAGAQLYNEAILITAIGSLPLCAGKIFSTTRKLGKTHQNVLVFVKGDSRAATEACGEVAIPELPAAAEDA